MAHEPRKHHRETSQPTTPKAILYLGSNTRDLTVTFAINGERWEYHLRSPQVLDSVHYLAQRWQGKGLALAKRSAIRQEKLN